MTLQEMLDHTGGFYLDDRATLLSGAADELFSDATLVRFLNLGADEFCRRTWRLQSQYSVAKAAYTGITLVEGQKDYNLHARVLRVLSAKLSDSDLDLRQIGYEDSRPVVAGYPYNDFFDINSPYTETPGRPYWYAVDIGTRVLRVRPTPSADEDGLVLQMRVVHMPITELTIATPAGVCEVEPEYHELLCMYAAGKALTSQNVDSDAKREGYKFLADFSAACREARNDFVKMTQSMPRFRFGGWARHGNY